ncbi:MAG: hypothetical protein KH341_11650 [Faecalibacterium sp.]|nr:hypothetical protein [Faecalibacterium sp.]
MLSNGWKSTMCTEQFSTEGFRRATANFVRFLYRTNEVVGWRMDFSSDANANFEGLLAVNREICMTQMAEKTSPDAPPNCAVVP